MNLKFLTFRPRRKRRMLTWREIAPNMVTSGNIVSGVVSIILSFHGAYAAAGWAVFAAVFFDLMDGMVARALGTGTQFGIEFDSIADVVSFGAAPALLFYAEHMSGSLPGGVAALLPGGAAALLPGGAALSSGEGIFFAASACVFALCGGLRLARFNVVHSAGSFQGIPIPAAGLFLSSFSIAGIPLNPIFAAVLAFAMAALMVSKVPYGNLKSLRRGYINKIKVFCLAALILSIAVFGKYLAPTIIMSLYVASGFIRFDFGSWLSLPEG